MQNLNFEPDLWAPIDFGPGVRQGANSVAVLEDDDGRWGLAEDFTERF
jgi:hypothetical protein